MYVGLRITGTSKQLLQRDTKHALRGGMSYRARGICCDERADLN